jgi:RHS repeat-associated protein
MTDATGTTTYAYDGLERLQSVTNGAGNIVTYGYDDNGNLTCLSYPVSGAASCASAGSGTGIVSYQYNAANQMTSLSDWLMPQNTTNFHYDNDANLTSEALPNGDTSTQGFDNADLLTSISDAPTANPTSPFATFSYTYYANQQLHTETDTGVPGPASQTYTYDAVGRLTGAQAGTFGYDPGNNLTSQPGVASAPGAVAQAFNTDDQITSATDGISLVGTSSGGNSGIPNSFTVSLPSGTQAGDQILLALTIPSGSTVTGPSGYNTVGTYTTGSGTTHGEMVLYQRTEQSGDTGATITVAGGKPKAATMLVYRGVNPTTPIDASSDGTTTAGKTVTAPSITTTHPTDQLVLFEGAAKAGSAGTWTPPSGMTTQVTATGGSSTAAAGVDQALSTQGATGTRTATFSKSAELIGALVALQPAITTYGYNSDGDRTSLTAPSGTATTLGYDQADELVAYGSNATYAYNGDGLRTSKTVSSTTQQFTWDLSGANPLLLSDGTNEYVYGPDGTVVEQIAGTTPTFYLHDQLGSTRVLTNSSGSVVGTSSYGSYGQPIGSTGSASTPMGYAGGYTDSESGLQYLVHRYYDPATGQFLSIDPLVAQTGSPYGYAEADPIDASDPSGSWPHFQFDPLGAVKGLTNFGSGLLGLPQPFGSSTSQDPLHWSYEIGNGAWYGLGVLAGIGPDASSANEPECSGEQVPAVIYRAGTPSPSNLTPRAVDSGVLSFRSSLSNPINSASRPVLGPGETYIGIDTSQLPPGSVVADDVPPGHVSVVGVSPQELRAAVIQRGRFPK